MAQVTVERVFWGPKGLFKFFLQRMDNRTSNVSGINIPCRKMASLPTKFGEFIDEDNIINIILEWDK